MTGSQDGNCPRDLLQGLFPSCANLYGDGLLAIKQSFLLLFPIFLGVYLIRFSQCLLFAQLLSGMSGVTGAALRETSHINKR